jgi:Xaa-Pro aminopeptidase
MNSEKISASKKSALLDLPRKMGAKAVVAMSSENFTYASGTHVITIGIIRPRYGFTILMEGRPPEVIVCSIETSLVKEESWIENIIEYKEFVDNPVDILVARLTANGITSGVIGVEADCLPKSAFDHLAGAIPGATWHDASPEFVKLRAVKSREEIDCLEKACHAAHSSILDAMEQSRVGETEATICGRIFKGVIDRGSDGILFLCFSSGDRIAHSHAHATDRVTKPGDLIRFDVAARWGAWCSDFARTYSAGDPTPLQRENYRKIVEIQQETIECVRPGVTAESVFFYCRKAFMRRNLPFHMPHVGHSFGHELHETPMLRPGEKTVITEGMVLNIEPALHDASGNFFHVEDLMEVQSDGVRLLSLGLAPLEIPLIGETVTERRFI